MPAPKNERRLGRKLILQKGLKMAINGADDADLLGGTFLDDVITVDISHGDTLYMFAGGSIRVDGVRRLGQHDFLL